MTKINKVLILLLLLLLIIPVCIKAQWTNLGAPQGGAISIKYLRGNLIVATPTSVYYSSNMGEQWNYCSLSSQLIFPRTINVIDKTIYAINYGNEYFCSTDAGVRWFQRTGPDYNVFTSIFKSDSAMYMGSTNGIFISRDDEYSWVLDSSSIKHSFRAFIEKNAKVFAATDSGVCVFYDNARNWRFKSDSITNLDGRDICQSKTNIFFASFGGGVYKSSNEGDAWKKSSSGLNNLTINKLYYESDTLFALTEGSGIYYSADEGENWFSFNSPKLNTTVYDMTKANNYYFAVTPEGVFKTPANVIAWEATSGDIPNAEIATMESIGDKVYVGLENQPGVYSKTKGSSKWTKSKLDNSDPYVPLLCKTKNKLFAFAQEKGLYVSRDAGLTWKHLYYPVLNYLPINSMVSKGDSILISTREEIYFSYDAGDTWKIVDVSKVPIGYSYHAEFTDNEIICGDCYSSDDGASWTPFRGPGYYGFSKTSAFIKNKLFIAEGYAIYKREAPGDTLKNIMKLRSSQSVNSILELNDIVMMSSPKYGIYYSTNLGDTWKMLKIEMPNLEDFKIKTSDSTLYSVSPTGVSFIEIPSKLNAPILKSPVNDSYQTIKTTRFTWASNYPFASHRIQVSKDSSFASVIIDTLVPSLTIVKSFNVDSSRYYFRVKSIFEHLESDWSSANTFFLGKKSDVQDESQTYCSVYPNPCKSKLSINLVKPEVDYYDLVLINEIGEHVLSIEALQANRINDIDLSGLASGSYKLILNCPGEKLIRKIQIVR